ncbi:hypothetical protein ACIBH1_48710 [Nonomuraea sp. NPDC050663]|uniref:hypothetical protein n=1 Tax=Nonomuraea sp. NPDC050663 TaxID=3364370 RepID=UPI0037AD35BC
MTSDPLGRRQLADPDDDDAWLDGLLHAADADLLEQISQHPATQELLARLKAELQNSTPADGEGRRS